MSDNFSKALDHITSNEPLQSRYLYGFSVISKKNLVEFQTKWPQITTLRRQQIMENLVEIAEHSFEVNFDPIFILGLNDPDVEVQTSAVEGLWENNDPVLIPLLVHLLKTGQTVKLRTAAAQALGQYIYLGELEEIDQTAVMVAEQALLRCIRQGDEALEVRRRAIEAIAYSGQEGIAQIIETAYYHEDERMQISAIFAMGRSSDRKKWEKIVLSELDNPSAPIRFEAVRAAGELQLAGAVPKLIGIVHQEADSEIQQSAIWSLGQIGGDEARDILESLLDSPDEATRSAAEEAMDELMLWSGDLDELFSYTIGVDDDDDDIHIIDLNGA